MLSAIFLVDINLHDLKDVFYYIIINFFPFSSFFCLLQNCLFHSFVPFCPYGLNYICIIVLSDSDWLK